MKKLLLAGLLLVAAKPVVAHDPCCEIRTSRLVVSSQDVVLSPGESKTFWVPDGWRRVERIHIDAYSRYRSSTLKVLVNGSTKDSLYVPTHDPSYTVDIHETTSTVQLWNRGYGDVVVTSVEVEVDRDWVRPIYRDKPNPPPAPPVGPIPFPSKNEASKFARRAAELVDGLRPYADPATEFVTYLMPIKTVAGRALAQANAHGPGSAVTRTNLEALQKQIEFAEPYIDATLKKDAPFEMVVELVSLKESIKDYLD